MNTKNQDMPINDFREHGHKLIDWIADYLETVESKPVLAQIKPGDIKNKLPESPPTKGENMKDIFSDVDNIIMPGMTHWNHPNFMAYFNSTASLPAILGDFLSTAFNTNAMIWKTSPASTELEEVVLNWFREMLQLPTKFFGIIYDLASVSSMHAIAAAREEAKQKYENYDITETKTILFRTSSFFN